VKPSINLGNFEFTPVSIKISGQPPVEQWTTPLRFALWCQRASPWWIGDLLNSGDKAFGEVFSQACEGAISGEMLQRYESVARRVPAEVRRPSLSWSAHAAVARLSVPQQRSLLLQAEEAGWSSEELRKKARQMNE
jgi:hypothetical protein